MDEFQELELKYYVQDLAKIESKLKELGASLSQERVLETNFRFDTPDLALSRAGKALRLRYDTEARLTFKGPSQFNEDIRLREEIEFTASSLKAAREFILALGYQIIVIYEKFRTVYDLDGVEVMLDELPYGSFIEIEGPDPASIQAVNRKLGLNGDARISDSYTVLFDRLRDRQNLPFRDLIFENFRDLQVSASDLGVQAAD